MEQIQITYSKSSGPGGQNVNKVNTKVDLRFHLESASWISDSIKEKLAAKVIIFTLKKAVLNQLLLGKNTNNC